MMMENGIWEMGNKRQRPRLIKILDHLPPFPIFISLNLSLNTVL